MAGLGQGSKRREKEKSSDHARARVRERERVRAHGCSGCGHRCQDLREHPILTVPICNRCWDRYHEGEFTIENGNEKYCRWCGEGGRLCMCDSCQMAFCSGCIARNFGNAEYARILDIEGSWSCFVCAPGPVEDLCIKNGWGVFKGLSDLLHKSHKSKHIVHRDISLGKERIPIPVVNEYDSLPPPLDFTYITRPVPGPDLRITCGVLSDNPSKFTRCCECTDNCRDPVKCACARASKGFAYNSWGRLHSPKLCVHECHMYCACNANRCRNRVVGKGLNLKLQVFRCAEKDKGWGVRCEDDIPAGAYVTDYIGEILTEEAANDRGTERGDEYLFSLDLAVISKAGNRLAELGMCEGFEKTFEMEPIQVEGLRKETILELLGEDVLHLVESRRPMDWVKLNQQWASAHERARTHTRKRTTEENTPPAHKHSRTHKHPHDDPQEQTETMPGFDPETLAVNYRQVCRFASNELFHRFVSEAESTMLTLDAKWFSNVGRFLNHSCSPNLTKVNVLSSCTDLRCPRVAFFAVEDIPAMTELTYDYGYCKGGVEGKTKACLCGSENCRKILY